MKYLKFLLLLIVGVFIFSTNNVYAFKEQFYEGELVNNAYLKKFKPGAVTGKYEQMRIFRRSSDNRPAYCIELWSNLDSNPVDYNYITSNYASYVGITEEQWVRIQLISYYGYEYANHTTDNWYAASQFLIWKTLEPNSTIYFTDTLNGNRVSKFEQEMSEIERLISNHFLVPSFTQLPAFFESGKSYTLLDQNGVIDNFDITTGNDISVEKMLNHQMHITIHACNIGMYSLNFKKKQPTEKTILYVNPSSQDLIIRGGYPDVVSQFQIKIDGGRINFLKIDSETKKPFPQGDASFDGTTYELYNWEHQLVQYVQIINEQAVTVGPLPYGTYYVKEVKSGEGYQVDPNEYTINLKHPSIVVNLEDEIYRGRVKIQKYYENGSSLMEEQGAEFEIYDSKNQLVEKIETNSQGQVEIDLPYGNYRFHQSKGKIGYAFVEDFFVSITEKLNQQYQFVLKNEPIKRYIKVVKKDAETKNEIVVDSASFRIKNLDTGEYVKQKLPYPSGDLIDVFSTNHQGFFITPEPLPIGNYQLEEVKAPIGYFPMESVLLFQISESANLIPNSDYGQIILIEIYNQPRYGLLTIQKQVEVFHLKEDQFCYDYQPLDKVSFNVYANKNIIAGDGTTLYREGDLVVSEMTDFQGMIQINLPMGEYYVTEVTFLDGYIKNEKRYFVDIGPKVWEATLKVDNYLKKGSIQIYKKDALTSNAISDTYFSIFNKTGDLIATIVTDQNGTASLDSLPLGEYYIEEVQSNPNYFLNHFKQSFQLTEEEQILTLEILNNPILPPKTSVNESNIKRFLLIEFLFEITFAFYLVIRRDSSSMKTKDK